MIEQVRDSAQNEGADRGAVCKCELHLTDSKISKHLRATPVNLMRVVDRHK